jgi:hypothetical protein
MLKALGTPEVLKGMLKVAAQISNLFGIGARLQRWNIDPTRAETSSYVMVTSFDG